MKVRVLGCSGAIARNCRTTSFLVDDDLLVDAGTGVGDLSLDEMTPIDDVVLTHSHLDHVAALPLMLDAVASRRARPLHVHALPETIQALRQHVFNNVIWPDFARIPSQESPFVCFHEIAIGQRLQLGTGAAKSIQVLPARHTVPACGFAVRRADETRHWVFSGDTHGSEAFWQEVNGLTVAALVIETAFSDREAVLANLSAHLSPSGLARELDLMRADAAYPVYITHTKPAETDEIMSEIAALGSVMGARARALEWLEAGQVLEI